MKRPHHMTMSELIALPVITRAEELAACPSDDPRNHGGAFNDDDGYLWRTIRTDEGWARYPAYLAIMANARREAPQAYVAPVAVVAAAAQGVIPSRPTRGVLSAVLRAFG